MPQCVVIADDLTGANATGVQLRQLSLRTATLIDIEKVPLDLLSKYDVITGTTESRYISQQLAYKRVYQLAARFRQAGVKLFNKRIDSTLRGNLGAEIDGILDGLGDDRVALVVPSFPQAGRIAVGGYMLVHGRALAGTDVAQDPKIPITTSHIPSLIKRQTKYPVATLSLDTVSRGARVLAQEVEELAHAGIRVLIFDALELEDIDLIAQGVIGANRPFVAVDPGPFTGILAKKMVCPKGPVTREKILMVLGSITQVAKVQLEETFKHLKGHMIEVQADRLILPGRAQEEVERALKEYRAHRDDANFFCITTQSLREDPLLDLNSFSRQLQVPVENISLRICQGLAHIAHDLIRLDKIKGVFSSGGDTTAALYTRLGAKGIELIREVEPLVAYGKLMGGDFQGLRVVTKGGMAGTKDSIKDSIMYLSEHI